MTKKKNQKRPLQPEHENKTQPKPNDVKNDCQENDVEVVEEAVASNTSQMTRRKKKNLKQQEKKKSEGNQPTTVDSSSSKTEILQKYEDVTEKSSTLEENENGHSWKSVEHSNRKSKNMEVKAQLNKETVVPEVNPYRQHKKVQNSTKVPAQAKEEKGAFDYFANEPVKNTTVTNNIKSNERKSKEFANPRRDDGAKDTVNVSKDYTDKDFDKFNILYKEKKFKESNYVKVKEIQEDLFNMPQTYALAHCVAEDMNMGSGIAVQFSQKFKRRDELYQQRQKQGGLAVLEDNGRFVYYLVTKKLSNGKPTTYSMWNSLQKLQQHIHNHKVKQLALPRIGCGLDRLEWSEIKAMIEYTFRDLDIEITVCNFQQPEEDTSRGSNSVPPVKLLKCPVRNVRYPLVDIESGTAIIYFGTVNGHVSEEMGSLDNKFRIMGDYKRATRKLGEVIQVYKNQQDYSLLGCITRNTEKDPFDFVSFQKCIVQIKKLNKSYYCYVGIQAFFDDRDDLLLNKITNMLRYSLIKVEVYVCWGGDMLKFMPPERGDFI